MTAKPHQYLETERLRDLVEEIARSANAVTDLGAPNVGETLPDLHDRLLSTRAMMSHVSSLVGDLVLLNGRARSHLIQARGEVEDAEAVSVATPRIKITEDFSSGKERNARLAAATIDQRVALRRAERLVAECDAALTYGRERHRELDRAVRDIDTRLRILSYEPNVS